MHLLPGVPLSTLTYIVIVFVVLWLMACALCRDRGLLILVGVQKLNLNFITVNCPDFGRSGYSTSKRLCKLCRIYQSHLFSGSITIYPHIFFLILESRPKLHDVLRNFGQTWTRYQSRAAVLCT